MPRPNVLLFITDGHRAGSVACYGNDFAQTPHFDAFAEEGVRFEQAYCVHSVCMPTRASMITGRYPQVHGVWANGIPLKRTEVTLPQVLGEAGYASAACGKVHFEPQQPYPGVAPRIEGSYYGFDEVHLSENTVGQEYLDWVDERYPELSAIARGREGVPEEAHELQWIADRAIGFMTEQVQSRRPFLCQCSFHELSPPCTPPPSFAGYFRPEDMPVPVLREEDLAGKPTFYRECYEGYMRNGRQPDETTLQRYIASYYDQQRFLDHQFGRVIEALKGLGAWENTIVVFTADHGLALNEHWQWRHGPFLFDEVSHIPAIWRVPGMAADGTTRQQFAEQVDLMPTLLELCGVQTPAGVQGQSLVPVLQDAAAPGKECVLLQERHAPDMLARGLKPEDVWQVAVRTQEWKLIHYVGAPYGELYDLQSDPGEFVNLWDHPAHRARRGELEALLAERLAATQDPLPVREYEW